MENNEMAEPPDCKLSGSAKETNQDDRGPGQYNSNTEPLVYTIAEAAALLKIGRSLVYNLANNGELPVIRLSKRILIPRKALLDMLEGLKGRAKQL